MKKETNELTLKTLEQIVQRRDDESQGAFSAFLAYCSLPTKERLNQSQVLKLVAEATGLSESTLFQYRQLYDWDERVSQVEAQRWIREEADRQEQIAADNKKFVAQNRKLKERTNNISLSMLEVAEKLLEKVKVSDEKIEEGFVETVDGRKVPTFVQYHVKAKVSDIPRIVESALKAQRYIQDLPTEVVETEIPIGADLSGLTVEELIALREKNQQILREKGALGKVQQISDKEQ